MLKNYILITLRNLMKNKLIVFINVLGLGFSIALCIIAYLNWRFAADWDIDQKNAKSIYRLQFYHDVPGKSERWGLAPMPLAEHVRENIAGIDNVVRFLPSPANFRVGDELFQTQVGYADSLFFKMFTFNILSGNIDDFKKKRTIFITDELARMYFDREDVVGETIEQIIQGAPHELLIGGVFSKPPLNSSFYVNAFILWDNLKDLGMRTDDWSSWNTTFLQITDAVDVERVTRGLQNYIEPQNNAREDFKIRAYYLQNFDGISRVSLDEGVRGNYIRTAMPKAVVNVPNIMAVLLLLLACFNFTNTSISLCGQRLKEIGIRKVIGGVKKELVMQFLGESLFLCFLGLLTGLLLAEFLVPAYDNLWTWLEIELKYADNIPFLLFLCGLLVLTALLAGGYSAFYVANFEPITILRGKTKFAGTNWLTRSLLGIQFSISILTIIFAIGFYKNAEYQKSYDLGYYTTGVISANVGNEGGFNSYRNALAGNPDIINIAGTKHHILQSFSFTTVKHELHERQVDLMEVGDEYLRAMNIRVIDGRGFIKDSQTDQKESILVSEEFVKQFNWKDAIGKRIVWRDTIQLYVIGVVKNIYSRALFKPIEPMMIKYAPPAEYTQLIVQVSPERMVSVNEFMEEKWKTVFPNVLYNGQFIDHKMKDTIETNNNVITIFGFIGVFALLMAATGLYTLVSLQILKRTKEIGVRKVMGASLANIVGVVSFEFLMVIFVACLAGGTVGFLMVNISMDAAWEYYERVTGTTFGLSVIVIFLLAVATTGYKTVSTAKMDPVKTLRDE